VFFDAAAGAAEFVELNRSNGCAPGAVRGDLFLGAAFFDFIGSRLSPRPEQLRPGRHGGPCDLHLGQSEELIEK
jgi:hypothetical protein